MTSTMLLPVLCAGPMVKAVGSVDMAVRLCFSQQPLLCVAAQKPLRPCIRPTHSQPPSQQPSSPVSATPPRMSQGDRGLHGEIPKRKRVVFADALGLSLTAVHIFPEIEKGPPVDPPPSFQQLTAGGSGCTISTSGQEPRLRLGFTQPSADFQTFHARLRETMVLLENCGVNAQALCGTVRVKNVSYRKTMHIRVTFDSWLSYLDVPCTFLQHAGPETDSFAFDIALPKPLDEKEKMEFCISYLPGGYSTAFWDNNNGQNYSLCQ